MPNQLWTTSIILRILHQQIGILSAMADILNHSVNLLHEMSEQRKNKTNKYG